MSPHAVTANVTPQAVQCVRAVAGPEPFSMIDQQAGLVVKLARILGEVLQGKESAHSLRLHDLEQRREELQRRHRAAVIAMPEACVGVDELQWTLETLDRVAAGLFRTARRCHQGSPGPGRSYRRDRGQHSEGGREPAPWLRATGERLAGCRIRCRGRDGGQGRIGQQPVLQTAGNAWRQRSAARSVAGPVRRAPGPRVPALRASWKPQRHRTRACARRSHPQGMVTATGWRLARSERRA